MGLNLLEKTELWVNEITLNKTNLTELANTVARVMGLKDGEVLVVDVRPRHITFDVLAKDIPQQNIMGKEQAILDAIRVVPGVTLYPDSYIHSNGILGQICAGVENEDEILERVAKMTDELRKNVAHRAIIFPTGFELQQGLIEDTNTPYLCELLEKAGYKVTVGEIMSDDLQDISEKLSDALNRGFGLIVTTGGVGAEDKDHSVEGICSIDVQTATPYIVKYEKGTGRHVKDGVRIGVGTEGLSMMVSLPGPHDEVELAAPVLLQGLRENWTKEYLADQLAAVLAEKWRQKSAGHGHHTH
ncbi:molybdopterin-binding protein [Oscillibacter ruminantium]|uniref:molybdopterin-binding protein n=1 Tax=Oscillibacter ruminantium TaxID=1263547 RepID=UPI0002E4A78A|nr:molybdopterin-binding protein [Oscillibacter ruminantium]MDD3228898.1 molybdopterin-binding protein [Oscillospiraceae bacterium]